MPSFGVFTLVRPGRRLLFVSALAGICSIGAPASPADNPQPPRSPAPQQPSKDAATTQVDNLEAAGIIEYKAPAITDPMLTPVPEAQEQLHNWTEALDLLRSRNTTLKIALLNVTQAQAQVRIALAATLPTITTTGTLTENLLRSQLTTLVPSISPSGQVTATPQTMTYPDATVASSTTMLTQPVLALRAWYAMGTADLNVQVSRLSADDTKRVIALGVANAIMSVVASERVAEVNRVELKAALERAELTGRRYALGASTILDVVRAEQDVTVARANIVTGDETLRRAREGLGIAIGYGHGIGVARDVSLNDLERMAKSTCGALDDVEQRADIVAAHKQVDVAARGINDVWLQFAPTINFQSRTDLTTSTQVLANQSNVAWSLSGVLTIPWWDGGARYGLLHNARAVRDQSEQQLEAARRQASVDVIQAKRMVKVSEDARIVAEENASLAKRAERLARASFALGKATSFELVDAGRQLRSAEINLIGKEFDVVQARIAAVLVLAKCLW